MNQSKMASQEDFSEFHEEWLSAYLDGELTPEQVVVVEQRLQADSEAQRMLLDLQRVRKLVGDLPGWSAESFSKTDFSSGAGLPTKPLDSESVRSELTQHWNEIVEGEILSNSPPPAAPGETLNRKEQVNDAEELPSDPPAAIQITPESSSPADTPETEFEPEIAAESDQQPASNAVPEIEQLLHAADDRKSELVDEQSSQQQTPDEQGLEQQSGDERSTTERIAEGQIVEENHPQEDTDERKQPTAPKLTDANLNTPVEKSGTRFNYAWLRPLAIAASLLLLTGIGYLLWPNSAATTSDVAFKTDSPQMKTSQESEADADRGRSPAFAEPESLPANMSTPAIQSSPQSKNAVAASPRELSEPGAGVSEPAADAQRLAAEARLADEAFIPPAASATSALATEDAALEKQNRQTETKEENSRANRTTIAGSYAANGVEQSQGSIPDRANLARSQSSSLSMESAGAPAVAEAVPPDFKPGSVVADQLATPALKQDINDAEEEDRQVSLPSPMVALLETSDLIAAGDRSWSANELSAGVEKVFPLIGLPKDAQLDTPQAAANAATRQRRDSEGQVNRAELKDLPVMVVSVSSQESRVGLFQEFIAMEESLIELHLPAADKTTASAGQAALDDSDSRQADDSIIAADTQVAKPILLLTSRALAERIVGSPVLSGDSQSSPSIFWMISPGRSKASIGPDDKVALLLNVTQGN